MALRDFEEPARFVEGFHNIDHLDLDLRRFDGIFEAPIDEDGNLYESIQDYRYGQTLVVGLIFMLVIGFAILVAHIVWSCCCCCCRKSKETDEFGKTLTYNSTRAAKIGTVIFGLLAIVAAIYGFTTVTDFSRATDGLQNADTSIRRLQTDALDIGNSLNTDIAAGVSQVNTLIDNVPPAAEPLTQLRVQLQAADNVVNMFKEDVRDSELSEDVPDYIDKAADVYEGLTIFIFVTALLVSFMAIANVFLTTDYYCLKGFLAWIGTFFMFIIWIAFTIEMILAILISDVCIDSDTALLDSVSRLNDLPADAEDILIYYVGCEETPSLVNPLNETVVSVSSELQTASAQAAGAVALLPPGNEDQADLLLAAINRTIGSVDGLGDIVACESVNPIYQEIQQGMCNDTILALGNAVIALALVVFGTFAARLFICTEKPDAAAEWKNAQPAGVNSSYRNLDKHKQTGAPASSGIDYAGDQRRIEMDNSRSGY